MPSVRSFTVLPSLPETLKDLDFLARNMFWCWNPDIIALFKRIDPNLWTACSQNPIKLLGNVSQERLEALADNNGFLCELKRTVDKLQNYLAGPTWFEKVCEKHEKPFIAYFSAEFGLHECLPIYAGGLGVLSGDHMKSASDLGIPLVGVGLLYQKGYFRQYLNIDGWQQEAYIENDFYNIPVAQVKDANGQPLMISVDICGKPVYAQIWLISVGRIKLYMLDTNVGINSTGDRIITSGLYGGDNDMRIRQEIMLGIGGLRALSAVGIKPAVCHMNEGHAGFMALERIRLLKNETGLSFDEALEATKAGNVFTIHTPVKAGLDEFSIDLMDKYFENYIPQFGIDRDRFLALGRFVPGDDKEAFKMPVLAIKLSSYRNGVSKLHGEVSRKMWSGLWPGVPEPEVPLISVTNGVHTKTWLSEEMNALFERYLGSNWSDETLEQKTWNCVEQIPDEEFWRTHQRCKGQLISFVRDRLKAQMQRRGTYHTELNWAEEVLDPEALTIGFARRFASYKRGNLLLKDPQRLIKLLNNTEKPLQIIFAGKAHPRDAEGKEIIRQIIHFANKYDVRRRLVFLEDYDISIARMLVHGVDVWLNNPRPPLEASGTSGMKAGINGALNLSTFDGWWCEGYKPEVGWVIGAGENYEDPVYQDVIESQSIYNILEDEIIPLYYTRSSDNLPRAWIHRVKNSIKWISGQFNTHRMVAEYARRFYNPALAQWQYLNANKFEKAKELNQWKWHIRNTWQQLHVRDVEVKVVNSKDIDSTPARTYMKVGSKLDVKALIRLGGTKPEDVSVELYHGFVDSWGEIRNGTAVKMEYRESNGGDGEHWFAGSLVCKTAGRQGVALRVLPKNSSLVSPYELGLILWETEKVSASVN